MMRCYNGAWDSKSLALFAEHDRLMDEIKQVEPDAHCTYFPVEQEFQVHVFGRQLSAQRPTKLAALQDAKLQLSQKEKTND